MKEIRKLKVKWSKREKDFMVYYPRRCDGALIQGKLFHKQMIFDYLAFLRGEECPYNMEEDFIEELEKRGYDKTTMKFEISLKQEEEQK